MVFVDWILLVWKMDAFYREIMAQFFFWTAVAFVILVLLIILLSRFTRPIRKSVSQIVEAMEQMEAGNFQIHLSPGEKDSLEIQKIREGLNDIVYLGMTVEKVGFLRYRPPVIMQKSLFA